jgi:hypothetical protein
MTRNALAWFALVVATAGWVAPIAHTMVRDGDYEWHLGAAVGLTAGIVSVPHLLFHAVVAVVVVIGATPQTAAIAATVIFQVAAACTVAWFIAVVAPDLHATLLVLLALAVISAGPILPPGTDRDLYMVGYFLPNAIHNPTVIAAKPFVPLLISLAAVAAGLAHRPSWSIPGGALVTVLAALAKPHYVSCIAPAAALCAAVRVLRQGSVRWRLLVLALAAPAILTLAGTYWVVRAMPGDATVSLAPFEVLRPFVAVNVGSLLQRIASDIAFPVVVILCWPSIVRRAPWLLLAWIAYGVALTQAFLLAETGPRVADGNFLWSPQLATFGLLASHAAVLPAMARADGATARWRVVLATSTLALHSFHGIWWVVGRVTPTGWWWALVGPPTLAAIDMVLRNRAEP